MKIRNTRGLINRLGDICLETVILNVRWHCWSLDTTVDGSHEISVIVRCSAPTELRLTTTYVLCLIQLWIFAKRITGLGGECRFKWAFWMGKRIRSWKRNNLQITLLLAVPPPCVDNNQTDSNRQCVWAWYEGQGSLCHPKYSVFVPEISVYLAQQYWWC